MLRPRTRFLRRFYASHLVTMQTVTKILRLNSMANMAFIIL